MNSRISFDLHTHTRYSHGKGSIADNAAMAAGLGLKRLGISDHGPGCLTFGIDLNGVPSMRKDIEKASELYPGLEISLGVEANTANADGSLDISKEDQKLFDYIIAGYHYSYLGKKPFTGLAVVLGGWAHERGLTTSQHARIRNTDFIVNSLYANNIYILSHPGDKADFDIDAIAKACEETDTIIGNKAVKINRATEHLAASLVADGDVGIAALVIGRAIDGDATAFEGNDEVLTDGLRLPLFANFPAE